MIVAAFNLSFFVYHHQNMRWIDDILINAATLQCPAYLPGFRFLYFTHKKEKANDLNLWHKVEMRFKKKPIDCTSTNQIEGKRVRKNRTNAVLCFISSFILSYPLLVLGDSCCCCCCWGFILRFCWCVYISSLLLHDKNNSTHNKFTEWAAETLIYFGVNRSKTLRANFFLIRSFIC